MASAEKILEKAVERLVRALRPRRIVLFGSHARGDARDDSDFDLMLLVDSDRPWYERDSMAYGALAGLGLPIEVTALTPAELDDERGVPGSLYWEIQRDGKVLYDAENVR